MSIGCITHLYNSSYSYSNGLLIMLRKLQS